jgi:hypothetical protein
MASRTFTTLLCSSYCAMSFLVACSSKGQHTVPAVDAGRTKVIDAPRAPAAKPDAGATERADAGATAQTALIVGSKRGLEAWQPDGS